MCKTPLSLLSVAAVCGGYLLSRSVCVVGPRIEVRDKLMPLVVISVGALTGYYVSNLKKDLFSNM